MDGFPALLGQIERRFGTLFRSVGIRSRLIITFLLVSIVPVVVVGVITSLSFSKALNDQVANYSSQLVAQVAKNMADTFDRMIALTENLIVHPTIQAGLKDPLPHSDTDRAEFLRKLDADISRMTYRDGKVSDANIFRLDGTLLLNTGYLLYHDIELNRILAGVKASEQNMYWTISKNNRDNPLLVVGRLVYDIADTNKAIGSLVLMLDERTFSRNAYYGIAIGTDAQLVLVERDGTVISSAPGGLATGMKLEDRSLIARLDTIQDELPNSFVWKAGNQTSLVCATAIPQTGWILMARIPDRVVESLARQMVQNIILVCLVVLLVISFLASVLFSSIQFPLGRLTKAAWAIQKGDFGGRIGDTCTDEVGQVSRAMDEMAGRLSTMVDEIQRREEEKRRVELEVLQSQINPHFLFNTLDSLKWTALLQGNEVIGEGIGALSSLLRNGVLIEDNTLTLEDEVKNLRNYALILKLRYGDSFRFETDCATDALAIRLPKLLLQPFVENAIVHGISYEAGALVTISMTARIEDGALVIRIVDDGQGFDDEGSSSGEDRFSGIGVTNVQERIRLWYGAPWGVVLESRAGQGTQVTVRLPAVSVSERR